MPEDYSRFVTAVSAAHKPEEAYRALCDLALSRVGAKLFTVMAREQENTLSRRVYSNQPEVYPVSGAKPVNPQSLTHKTLAREQTFVANDIAAIAEVFDDHELIRSLGCESVINVPIIIRGKVAGSINCLHEAGHYTRERVEAAEALKLPGTVCLLLAGTSGGSDVA